MDMLNSYLFQSGVAEFLILLFLLGGLITLAVGAGLILWNEPTQRILAALNRWVSTRRWLKPLDVPHDTTPAAFRFRRGLAVVFVAGACYALVGLSDFNERAFVQLLGLDAWPPDYTSLFAETVRWILLLGNAAAIVAGVMLAFFPAQFAAIEAKGGKWISDRQVAKGGDAMNVPFDKWVAGHPRTAGWFMAIAGILMVVDFGLMWARLG